MDANNFVALEAEGDTTDGVLEGANVGGVTIEEGAVVKPCIAGDGAAGFGAVKGNGVVLEESAPNFPKPPNPANFGVGSG